MIRLLLLLLASMACTSGMAARSAESSGNVPTENTPRKLQEAWLEFHETDLCQDVDAVFLFKKSEVEVWSRIESDKSHQKFQALFDSPKNSYGVALYTTRAEVVKKKDDEDPPPSLWQNFELRRNLGEFALTTFNTEERTISQGTIQPSVLSPLMKQRLKIYGEQVLNWNKRMERYALDMVALTRVACSPDGLPAVKAKANAVCRAHAQNLDKQVGKLIANLEQAIPSSEKTKRKTSRPAAPMSAADYPVERAVQISSAAQRVSRRIHRFIYPEDHTVELDELRYPSLLDSLGALRQMVAEFDKTPAAPARRK